MLVKGLADPRDMHGSFPNNSKATNTWNRPHLTPILDTDTGLIKQLMRCSVKGASGVITSGTGGSGPDREPQQDPGRQDRHPHHREHHGVRQHGGHHGADPLRGS